MRTSHRKTIGINARMGIIDNQSVQLTGGTNSQTTTERTFTSHEYVCLASTQFVPVLLEGWLSATIVDPDITSSG